MATDPPSSDDHVETAIKKILCGKDLPVSIRKIICQDMRTASYDLKERIFNR